MKRDQATRTRIALAAITGGLAFVGSANAIELLVDGNFENTVTETGAPTIVKVGGKANPGVGGGWSFFSTYNYSANYTMPLTNGLGTVIGGAQFLRPYPSGTYGVVQSSTTVTQVVSLTALTTLTPAKIDSGSGLYTLSAWFCTYRGDNDNSDFTLNFLDGANALVGSGIMTGGADFVAALPGGDNGRYANARFWGQDSRAGTIPTGARFAEIVIQSHSLSGAPDGYVDVVSLDVVDTTERAPVLGTADPPDNAVSVGPVVNISVTLQDRVTAVNTNTVKLYLDNNLVIPSIQKVSTNTIVQYAAGLLPALSAHTYQIVFSDNGTPVTAKTNLFHFTVADYLTLPASLGSPLGSEDTTKPGFTVKVYQVETLSDPSAVQTNIVDSIEFGEGVLAGLAGTNVADLAAAAGGNTFNVPNVVNWVNSVGTTPNFPVNEPFPGIPGTTFIEDNFVHELLTFVRFPAAGFYQMGINNNDDLRLSAGRNGVLALQLISPTNVAIPCVAIATNVTQLLWGGSLPLTPLVALVAYGTPSGNPDDACFEATNTSLAGKIVVLDRGTATCTDDVRAEQAQAAGAVAVLLTTPGDTGFPFRLGGANTNVHIPVMTIAESYGAGLLKSYLTNGIPVRAQILGDANPRIVEWNGPKGFGNVDVLTGFAVPAAGVYPLRLVAGHSTGGADLEWFSVRPDGTRILLNDTNNANALVAFRGRNAGARPVLNNPSVAAGAVTLSWTRVGLLEEATSVNGPWYISPRQNNPQTIPANGQIRFYRVRQF